MWNLGILQIYPGTNDINYRHLIFLWAIKSLNINITYFIISAVHTAPFSILKGFYHMSKNQDETASSSLAFKNILKIAQQSPAVLHLYARPSYFFWVNWLNLVYMCWTEVQQKS